MEMHQIEKLTYSLSKARSVLLTRTKTLEEEINAAKTRKLRGIKTALIEVIDAQSKLAEAIEASPQLFIKPRSATFHGIRVGMQKGKGKIDYEDDAHVIKLIKKHCPDKIDLLINVTEKLVKKALEKLPASDLKKIGVTVIGAKDWVLINPADSAIDKMVKALMADLEKLELADKK